MPFKQIDTKEGRVLINTDHVAEGIIQESEEVPGTYYVGVLMASGRSHVRVDHTYSGEKDAILALDRFISEKGEHVNLTSTSTFQPTYRFRSFTS